MGIIGGLIGAVWLVENWKIVVGVIVGLIVLIAMIRSAKRSAAQQRAQQAAAAVASPAPAPKPEPAPEPAKPRFITPPKYQAGLCLLYFYPDVEFDIPPEMEAAAKAVPPLKQLGLRFEDGGEGVLITYEGKDIGRMRENRLVKMVHDFNREDRDILAASCEWTDKPMFSLGFYESLDALQARWKNADTYKEFTLTGNGNAEMQDYLNCIDPGEEVSLDYDPEKEKTAVSAGGLPIGYCSAAMETYVDEHHGIKGRILKITESDSGKLGVRVMLIADD